VLWARFRKCASPTQGYGRVSLHQPALSDAVYTDTSLLLQVQHIYQTTQSQTSKEPTLQYKCAQFLPHSNSPSTQDEVHSDHHLQNKVTALHHVVKPGPHSLPPIYIHLPFVFWVCYPAVCTCYCLALTNRLITGAKSLLAFDTATITHKMTSPNVGYGVFFVVRPEGI
jgi:hypothetical protein